MREILFRGKKVDDKTWVRGYLSKSRMHGYKGNTLQLCIDHENNGVMLTSVVDPETVGQWTGLTDKNGVKIFEGDILKGDEYPYLSDGNCNYFAEVVWFDNAPAFGLLTIKNIKSDIRGISAGNTDWMEGFKPETWEIIGNIHDNPELLEVH